jgi:hypothetical protein
MLRFRKLGNVGAGVFERYELATLLAAGSGYRISATNLPSCLCGSDVGNVDNGVLEAVGYRAPHRKGSA